MFKDFIPANAGKEAWSTAASTGEAAIYGKVENKRKAYDASLTRWWTEYADRKNDEEEEHVADSLLYDKNHLPRMAPPPECVHDARAALSQAKLVQSMAVRPVEEGHVAAARTPGK